MVFPILYSVLFWSILAYYVLSYPVLAITILGYPGLLSLIVCSSLSYPTVFCLILAYYTQSNPILTNLSLPKLDCPILAFFVLSYPIPWLFMQYSYPDLPCLTYYAITILILACPSQCLSKLRLPYPPLSTCQSIFYAQSIPILAYSSIHPSLLCHILPYATHHGLSIPNMVYFALPCSIHPYPSLYMPILTTQQHQFGSQKLCFISFTGHYYLDLHIINAVDIGYIV